MENRAEVVSTLVSLSRSPELYSLLKKRVVKLYNASLKDRYEQEVS